MKSQTASQIEAARKNIREALSILSNTQPEGLNDTAWGEMMAGFACLDKAIRHLDECKYQDALKQPAPAPKRLAIRGRTNPATEFPDGWDRSGVTR